MTPHKAQAAGENSSGLIRDLLKMASGAPAPRFRDSNPKRSFVELTINMDFRTWKRFLQTGHACGCSLGPIQVKLFQSALILQVFEPRVTDGYGVETQLFQARQSAQIRQSRVRDFRSIELENAQIRRFPEMCEANVGDVCETQSYDRYAR